MENWLVVGGGAAGAYIAWRGVRSGQRVTVVESASALGGLTRTDTFDIDDGDIDDGDIDGEPVVADSFYHVILESDRHVLGLLSALGLADQVRWTAAPAAIVSDGIGYPASSIGEMARLPALRFADRVRIAGSVAATLALPMASANRQTAARWLGRVAGRSALDAFWTPMLRAKLGTQADSVAASFMVATLRRLIQARLRGTGDRFGILPSGYDPVFAELARRIEAGGGVIRTSAQAMSVTGDGRGVSCTLTDGSTLYADRVFLTAPGPAISAILPQLSDSERHQLTAAPYLGVVCATMLLDEPPNDAYITYLVDDLGLTGVIGMHALRPPETTAGKYLIYLPRYCAADDPWFDEPDEVLAQRFEAALRRAFPGQTPKIAATKINKARHVVPLPLPDAVPVLGHNTSIPKVHVISAAQNTTGTLNVEGTLQMARCALDEIGGRR